MRVLFSTVLLALMSSPVWANTPPNTVPEPGSLALVGVAVAAAVAVARRKKK